jgi:hypothetical protein
MKEGCKVHTGGKSAGFSQEEKVQDAHRREGCRAHTGGRGAGCIQGGGMHGARRRVVRMVQSVQFKQKEGVEDVFPKSGAR